MNKNINRAEEYCDKLFHRDDYNKMNTNDLLTLEDKMAEFYYKFIENDNYEFSLFNYAEVIRELTIRENK